MRLSSLLRFNDIYIQCHDNPDADTIGSGFGIYCYFQKFGKVPHLFYAGKHRIQKSNLLMMVRQLKIPLEYTDSIPQPELLVLVDCQYRQGNVTVFEADQIAVIDHHEPVIDVNEWTEIQSSYSSCATVTYSLLVNEKFNINENPSLATALYYGMYMDTNCFSEIKHPLDLDMIEYLHPLDYVIRQLKYSNITEEDLEIAGKALLRYEKVESIGCAIARTSSCDSNLLGLISDLILQADTIFTCIVYHKTTDGYRFSVRSCQRDARADDIISFLTERIGDGGGHKRKAGGYIKNDLFLNAYPKYDIKRYLICRMKEYFLSYDIIDAVNEVIDTGHMELYKKLSIPIHFVKTTDLAVTGSPLIIRTLQGDVTIKSGKDIFIMVSPDGEACPIKRQKFEKDYYILNEPANIHADYTPTIHNKKTDEVYRLEDYCKTCISKTSNMIWAKQLEKTTKIFTDWYFEDYMLGRKGDYLVIENPGDVFIVREKVFLNNCQKICE